MLPMSQYWFDEIYGKKQEASQKQYKIRCDQDSWIGDNLQRSTFGVCFRDISTGKMVAIEGKEFIIEEL